MINAKDMFAAAEFQGEHDYYKGSLARPWARLEAPARATGPPAWRCTTSPGPARRQIGFMPVDCGGIHRIWYSGGRWAYASALLDGLSDNIFMTVGMSDPTRPRRPGAAGCRA